MTMTEAPEVVLEARELQRDYLVSSGFLSKPRTLRAVNGVSFSLEAGRTLAVVGESGCGKSTLARLVTMIERPTAGQLQIGGVEVGTASPDALRAMRPSVQLIFQDPFGSLNPRKRIGDILDEPLAVNTGLDRDARHDAVTAMLERVGLRPEHAARYPHMFSGGQRQRVAIARALILNPKIVVADEPVSALDVSVRAQVLNLMMDLQEELAPSYLFISHDLGVVRHIADRVMVMYLGAVVEHCEKERFFARPLHPYSQALLAATPSIDGAARSQHVKIAGELPSPFDQFEGCAFARRCPAATSRCRSERPALRSVDERLVACHHADGTGAPV
jgi:dipeptide transport system ATP-binding protein